MITRGQSKNIFLCPFSAWWRQPTQQTGDPSASLLLTSEKAVFFASLCYVVVSHQLEHKRILNKAQLWVNPHNPSLWCEYSTLGKIALRLWQAANFMLSSSLKSVTRLCCTCELAGPLKHDDWKRNFQKQRLRCRTWNLETNQKLKENGFKLLKRLQARESW